LPGKGLCEPGEWLRGDCTCERGECRCGSVRVVLAGPESIGGEPGRTVVMVVRLDE